MSDVLLFEQYIDYLSDSVVQGGVTPRIIGATAISATLADVNGDGLIDFVFGPGDWPTGEIQTFPYLWLQKSDGTFQSSVVDSIPQLSFPGPVFVKDFNNDGLMDIYVGTLGNELIIPDESQSDFLYLQQADGAFQIDDRTILPKTWAHGTTVGDLNDDGWMDVLSTSGTGDGTNIYWGSSNGFVIVATDITGPPSTKAPFYRDVVHRARIQDFDGDGRTDLLIGASGFNSPIADGETVPIFPSEITYAYGRADEKTVALPIPNVSWMDLWAYEINNSQIGDLDGDGDMDLIIVYMNNGGFVKNGTFYPSWGADTQGVTVDPRESNRIVQILRNDGDHYTDVTDHATSGTKRGGTPPFEVNILDFNADGHLDIEFGTAVVDSEMDIRLGDSNFDFHEPASVVTPNDFRGEITDVNGDGVPDFVNAWSDWNEPMASTYMVMVAGIGSPKIWYGTSNDDAVRLRNQNEAHAGVGDDHIIGTGLADTVWGGWNNDTITGDAGNDRLYGEHGRDVLSGGGGNDTLLGGNGNDKLFDAFGNNVVEGNAGHDKAAVHSGNSSVKGNSGTDLLVGGIGADRLEGGSGNDVLIGDLLDDLGGNDRLIGGTGNDLLQGGFGADEFHFHPSQGDDIIGRIKVDYDDTSASTFIGQDFISGLDQIHLTGFGYATGADAKGHISDVAGTATFSDQGTTIVFEGLTASQLSDADLFVF